MGAFYNYTQVKIEINSTFIGLKIKINNLLLFLFTGRSFRSFICSNGSNLFHCREFVLSMTHSIKNYYFK